MMEKLIFLALDGLSWNVIKEMLSENKLKNIKKLSLNNLVSIFF